MISLTTGDFFSIVLLLIVGSVAFLALRLQMRKKMHDWRISSRHLFECDRCHLSFIPEKPIGILPTSLKSLCDFFGISFFKNSSYHSVQYMNIIFLISNRCVEFCTDSLNCQNALIR